MGAGGFGGRESALGIRAKRKRGQVIENKQSGETTNFAPPMISITYDPGAKGFISLREMNPFVFVGFPSRRGSKRNGAKSTARLPARAAEVARRGSDDPKWRRKPLESLKTDAEMA